MIPRFWSCIPSSPPRVRYVVERRGLFNSSGDVESTSIYGFVFEEIAEYLLVLNRAEETGHYFLKAYELLIQDPRLAQMEPQRLARSNELANA